MMIAIGWAWIRPGIPSAISLTRFGSVWYLPVLVWENYRLTFLLAAVAAGATDWLDGYLARKWECQSTWGGFFDLLGDKAFCIVLMLLGLAVWDYAWWYWAPCVALAIYHLVVMSLRLGGALYWLGFEKLAFFHEKFTFRSSRVAKTKMFVEATGLIMCFSGFGLGPTFDWAGWFGILLIWFASTLTLWSMFVYLKWVRDLPEWLWRRLRLGIV